jgi:hypothetical protein
MKWMAERRVFFCVVATTLAVGGLLLFRATSFAAPAADDVVTATGIGKIASRSAVSRELARRAALTDARRNLLIEARKIRGGNQRDPNISGHVGYHWIVSERKDSAIYRVTLAARLADLRVD